jgi:hypothetical protein
MVHPGRMHCLALYPWRLSSVLPLSNMPWARGGVRQGGGDVEKAFEPMATTASRAAVEVSAASGGRYRSRRKPGHER